jgi:hypothetical protein
MLRDAAGVVLIKSVEERLWRLAGERVRVQI